LIRQAVCDANKALRTEGLVTMHSGNVSGRDGGVLYIKPSGMDYAEMTPDKMVPVNIATGEVLETTYKPSVDLPHHLYLYRNDPSIQAVVHTHSNYATAFAAHHRPIPLVLTAIADEFGGAIPCAPYVDNEGDRIGQAILAHRTQAPAILLGNHGVFAWGGSVKDALKAAVMVEDVAKTVHLALQLGDPVHLDAEEALKWWDRYHNRYGQHWVPTEVGDPLD
jgi:L-ribulose-5-phosphate 4-epimerase